MKLAILIPARNEGPRIGRILREAQEIFPGVQCVVVNSASSDNTVEVALAHGAEVVDQGGPGYAGALAAGYRHLVRGSVDTVLQIDGDGQHPPCAGPRLLKGLEAADWVIGSRAGTQSPSPFARKAARQILSIAVRSSTGQSLGDVTSGYWALNRTTLETFAEHFPTDVADANIRVLANRLGLEVLELPVEMSTRIDGVSMHGGLSGVRNLGRSLLALGREARKIPRKPSKKSDSMARQQRVPL